MDKKMGGSDAAKVVEKDCPGAWEAMTGAIRLYYDVMGVLSVHRVHPSQTERGMLVEDGILAPVATCFARACDALPEKVLKQFPKPAEVLEAMRKKGMEEVQLKLMGFAEEN